MESNGTKKENFIYLRGLRRADHTVFCVQDGQKFYYDEQFNKRMAYSSGQQVKRSVLTSVLEALGEKPAPITFNFTTKGEQKEPWAPCDPKFPDQLLGGWMRAKKEEGNEGSTADTPNVVKRRSPFSFSAMRPLHPLLGGLESVSENLTFDRSSHPDIHPVIIRDEKGKPLSKEEAEEFIRNAKKPIVRRAWIPDHKRASGLFVYDVAIDLRTLFSVSLADIEPEIDKVTETKLREAGWIESKNDFGPCLVAPAELRQQLIPAIADGLIDWRITSNQSRTFSLMETLAIAVSTDAYRIPAAIRAKLKVMDSLKPGAEPVLDIASGANLFITLAAEGYIPGVTGDIDAIPGAIAHLESLLSSYSFHD